MRALTLLLLLPCRLLVMWGLLLLLLLLLSLVAVLLMLRLLALHLPQLLAYPVRGCDGFSLLGHDPAKHHA
jgi:hypothetical protein